MDTACENRKPLVSDMDVSSANVTLWRQVVAAIIGSMLGVTYGMAYGFTSPSNVAMKAEGVLTGTEIYFFASVLNLGLAFGGPIGSILIEAIGRKGTLLVTTGPWVLGWTMIALGTGPVVLFIGRILTGISCGVTTTTAHVYSSEVTSRGIRGLISFCFITLVALGILLSYSIGYVLHWRYLAVIAIFFPIIQLVLLVPIPESPRWLLQKGKTPAAQKALQWLRGRDADILAEYNEMLEHSLKTPSEFSARHLRQACYYKPFVLSLVVMVGPQIAGHHVFSLYLSEVFFRAGWQGHEDIAAIGVAAFQLIPVLLSAVIIERLGRRPLFILTACVCSLSCGTMGLAYVLQDEAGFTHTGWLSLTSVSINLFAYYMGFGGASPILMVELLPMKVRGILAGTLTSITYAFAFGITAGYPFIVGALNDYGTFWIFSGLALVSLIIIILYLPETKGKSLEEIEAMWAVAGYTYIKS